MTDEARRLKNDYQKNWRRKNPDKVKAANDRYWERKAEQLAKEQGGQGHVTI